MAEAGFKSYRTFYTERVMPALERHSEQLQELTRLEGGFTAGGDAEQSFKLHRLREQMAHSEGAVVQALDALEGRRCWAEHDLVLGRPLEHQTQVAQVRLGVECALCPRLPQLPVVWLLER